MPRVSTLVPFIIWVNNHDCEHILNVEKSGYGYSDYGMLNSIWTCIGDVANRFICSTYSFFRMTVRGYDVSDSLTLANSFSEIL